MDTKDRAILEPIRDQLRITRSAWAELLPILHRFAQRPDAWTEVLLDHTAHADRDTVYAAWGLLGRAGRSRLARPLDTARRGGAVDRRQRENAMRALGHVAGRTVTGLPELAAVAANPAVPEEERLRAIEILGNAADARAAGRAPEASRAREGPVARRVRARPQGRQARQAPRHLPSALLHGVDG